MLTYQHLVPNRTRRLDVPKQTVLASSKRAAPRLPGAAVSVEAATKTCPSSWLHFKPLPRFTPLKVTVFYVCFSALVVIYSGKLINSLGLVADDVVFLATIRGLVLTIATGVLLFLLTRRDFVALVRAADEIRASYDATLKGWTAALDLRDQETRGHSERVVGLTVRLAHAMGIRGDMLEHIRRGALLHDIGKIGVSDAILRKPGPLTDEETEVMKQHPLVAFRLLEEVEFLQPAIDIPYCHHEKWDGTGYPRGLKGEEIPFVARIFAIVDVWDSLTTDRPYRTALPKEDVLQHVQSLSGTHFDPNVVEAFLSVVNGNDSP